MQTTLVLVKPDGVQRALVGEVISRLEAKGLQLVGLKLLKADQALLEAHYSDHKERPFFPGLVKFMGSSPVVAMAWRGHGAIPVVRSIMGKTDGKESAPGTLRGDFGMSRSFNLVHGSDSEANAEKELGLWFTDGVVDYDLGRLDWVYDASEDA